MWRLACRTLPRVETRSATATPLTCPSSHIGTSGAVIGYTCFEAKVGESQLRSISMAAVVSRPTACSHGIASAHFMCPSKPRDVAVSL